MVVLTAPWSYGLSPGIRLRYSFDLKNGARTDTASSTYFGTSYSDILLVHSITTAPFPTFAAIETGHSLAQEGKR